MFNYTQEDPEGPWNLNYSFMTLVLRSPAVQNLILIRRTSSNDSWHLNSTSVKGKIDLRSRTSRIKAQTEIRSIARLKEQFPSFPACFAVITNDTITLNREALCPTYSRFAALGISTQPHTSHVS